MIRAGKFRNRITIQNFTTTRDAIGAEVKSWATFDAVWAAVEPRSGRELFNEQFTGEVDTLIRIRYRSGINEKMRIVWGSRTYQIKAVLDQQARHKELHLMCRELNPEDS
ncbi:MAG: head-tail adaptor protein [Spongiibacteraceae bacterium]|uniref:phage head closure protein n=1 Tax=uncultured Haliea sp. TaxID=622616 RepID=UPI000C3718E8|nr:head-tail adaptor protein [Spongiibacteraceae bacterium]|tara:strand:+ start:23223 stop:23552 length:330 start_codon:yes stop_codon:yes gene_type:complete